MFSPISAVSSARLSDSRKISRFFKNLNPTEINVLRKAQAKKEVLGPGVHMDVSPLQRIREAKWMQQGVLNY